MENNEKKIDIFYPSFKFEKKTKAFNKYIWFFVSVISAFSVGLLVFTIFHAFTYSILNLVSSFIVDNIGNIGFLPVIMCIILGYQFVQLLLILMTSYKFEDGKIIKGMIKNVDKVKGLDLAVDAALLTNMIKNIDNSSSVVASNAALNLGELARLISLNTNRNLFKNILTRSYIKSKYTKIPN